MRKDLGRIIILIFITLVLSTFAHSQFIDDGSSYQIVANCGVFNTSDAIYVLNSSINTNSTCFTFNENNITFDMNNSVITGKGTGYVLNITDNYDITIINGTIENSTYAIYLSNSSNGIFKNVNFTNNTYGIYMDQSSMGILNNLKFQKNQYGLYNLDGNNNSINNTNFFNTTIYSVFFSGADENNITNSLFQSNQYSIEFLSSSYNRITNVNVTDTSNDGIGLLSSTYNKLQGLNISNSSKSIVSFKSNSNYNNLTDSFIELGLEYGLELSSSTNNILKNNTLTLNTKGIVVQNSDGTNILDSVIYGSIQSSMDIINSDNVIINFTIINQTTKAPLNITNSNNIKIRNNTMYQNVEYFDMLLENSTTAIYEFYNYSIKVSNDYGLISFFNQSLNASGSLFSNIVSITQNNVHVNSSKGEGFNSTSNITIKNLAYAEQPTVLVDYYDNGSWETCMTCSNISWDGTNYKFNTTHFTSYKATASTDIYECRNLTQSNKTYTLKQDLNPANDCIFIFGTNVTLDLGGYTINGPNTNTAVAANSSNIKILNGIIKSFNTGIKIQNSSTTVSLVTIRNTTTAIFANSSSEFTLNNNTIRDNYLGIYFNTSKNNILSENTITNNTYGIYFNLSTSNTINYSNIYNNTYNLFSISSGTVSALYNFWDKTTQSNILATISGSSSVNPFLLSEHPDTTAPVITVISPSNSSTLDYVDIEFALTSDDRVNMDYRMNNSGSWTSWTSCYTITSEVDGDGNCSGISQDDDASYKFQFRGTNAIGLQTIVNQTYTIGSTATGEVTTTDTSSSSGGDSVSLSVKVTRAWTKIVENANLTASKDNFSIYFIKFKVTEEISNPKLTVEKTEKPSSLESPVTDIYQFFKITPLALPNDKLEDVSIDFSVSRAWMLEKKLSAYDIRLLRYTTKWEELDTRYLLLDSDTYYFRAITPGFSYFAVSYKSTLASSSQSSLSSLSSIVTSTSSTSTSLANVTTTTIGNVTEDSTQIEEESEVQKVNKGSWFKFVFLILLFLTISAFVLLMKFNQPFRDKTIIIINSFTETFKEFRTKSKPEEKVNVPEEYPEEEPEEIIEESKEIEEESYEEQILDLKEYVQKYLNQGFTKSEIIEQLKSEGVESKEIKKLFKA